MGRGLERRRVLGGDADKADFLERLCRGLENTGSQCLAWALMSNHYHLLIRVGETPLPELMGRLLGGYASAYNRRHRRSGYVFQNRYKSILCDEEAYLLALVRYIHRNPLTARLVANLNALEDYRWTGHAVLVGRMRNDWQETKTVLRRFGRSTAVARRRYRQFMNSVNAGEPRMNLDGGGLIRSYGGWENVVRARTEHERSIGDERILGDSGFVERALQGDRLGVEQAARLEREGWNLESLIGAVCAHFELEVDEIGRRSRNSNLSQARGVICYLGARTLKLSGRSIAARLQMSAPAVTKAIQRGQVCCRERGIGIENLNS